MDIYEFRQSDDFNDLAKSRKKTHHNFTAHFLDYQVKLLSVRYPFLTKEQIKGKARENLKRKDKKLSSRKGVSIKNLQNVQKAEMEISDESDRCYQHYGLFKDCLDESSNLFNCSSSRTFGNKSGSRQMLGILRKDGKSRNIKEFKVTFMDSKENVVDEFSKETVEFLDSNGRQVSSSPTLKGFGTPVKKKKVSRCKNSKEVGSSSGNKKIVNRNTIEKRSRNDVKYFELNDFSDFSACSEDGLGVFQNEDLQQKGTPKGVKIADVGENSILPSFESSKKQRNSYFKTSDGNENTEENPSIENKKISLYLSKLRSCSHGSVDEYTNLTYGLTEKESCVKGSFAHAEANNYLHPIINNKNNITRNSNSYASKKNEPQQRNKSSFLDKGDACRSQDKLYKQEEHLFSNSPPLISSKINDQRNNQSIISSNTLLVTSNPRNKTNLTMNSDSFHKKNPKTENLTSSPFKGFESTANSNTTKGFEIENLSLSDSANVSSLSIAQSKTQLKSLSKSRLQGVLSPVPENKIKKMCATDSPKENIISFVEINSPKKCHDETTEFIAGFSADASMPESISSSERFCIESDNDLFNLSISPIRSTLLPCKQKETSRLDTSDQITEDLSLNSSSIFCSTKSKQGSSKDVDDIIELMRKIGSSIEMSSSEFATNSGVATDKLIDDIFNDFGESESQTDKQDPKANLWSENSMADNRSCALREERHNEKSRKRQLERQSNDKQRKQKNKKQMVGSNKKQNRDLETELTSEDKKELFSFNTDVSGSWDNAFDENAIKIEKTDVRDLKHLGHIPKWKRNTLMKNILQITSYDDDEFLSPDGELTSETFSNKSIGYRNSTPHFTVSSKENGLEEATSYEDNQMTDDIFCLTPDEEPFEKKSNVSYLKNCTPHIMASSKENVLEKATTHGDNQMADDVFSLSSDEELFANKPNINHPKMEAYSGLGPLCELFEDYSCK